MNKNSRILPHLTIHYLQQKAYNVHRKKIDYIKQSLRTPNSKIEPSFPDNFDNSSKPKLHNFSQDKMSTIKEQIPQKVPRLTPFDKRRLSEYNK